MRIYGHIEEIPASPEDWDVKVRGAARLADTLGHERDAALLFRRIATVVRDVPGCGAVDDWRWTGPTDDFERVSVLIDDPQAVERVRRLSQARRERSS